MRSTISASMRASRSPNGAARAGYTRTIRAAGFNGTAAITWAAATRTTRGRSGAGRPFAATSGRSRRIARRAISPADGASARRCCTGPTTAARSERLGIQMGALRDFELAGWQSAASSYAGFAGATRLFVPALVRAAGARPGLRLLDVACGAGLAARMAADSGARVTGVDFSPAMIEMAQGLHPQMTFHVGDAEALPFGDRSFDAVIANFGIHHVEHPERAIAEARRMLTPDGTFAFTFWAKRQENTAWRIIFDAITACGRLDVPMPAGNDARATRENFSQLVSDAG